jgi:RNA polymerase sigma-70 factor (ECF subfamily)
MVTDGNKEIVELVKAVQSGDRKALEQLCGKLNQHVRFTISKIIHDPDIQEDISQEIYLRLIRNITQLREPVKIKYFVSSIALCVINDHFREKYKKGYPGFPESGKPDDKQPAIDEKNEDDILNGIALDEAIKKIPNLITQKIFQLKLVGKKNQEIADTLSISEGAVKMKFKRGVEFLKNYLNR